MQVLKSYSGEIDVGSTANRLVSYGAAVTVSLYTNKVDFLNQTIASFLHDTCGVDAAYEIRAGSTEKFLWIYDVPFLFTNPNYMLFYGPFSGNVLIGNSSSHPGVFSGPAAGVYSFSLVFTGNPETGFALRFMPYNVKTINANLIFCFFKAKNTASGGNSVVWKLGTTVTNGLVGGTNGIDLDESGNPIQSSYSTATVQYLPYLFSKVTNKAAVPDKLPLVPIMVGIWKLTGMYCLPNGYNLPTPLGVTSENQTEISISGRKFIVTIPSINNTTSGVLNMGLVEVNR